MNKYLSIMAPIFGGLLVVLLVVGAAWMAYDAGHAQGLAQSPEVAAAIRAASEEGKGLPAVGYYGHSFDSMPTFGNGRLFGLLLFVFLLFMALRLIFRPLCGPAYWHAYRHYHHYPWGGPPWMAQPEGENKPKGETFQNHSD